MKHIRRLFRIHRIFVVQELKRMMEYKGDFMLKPAFPLDNF